MTHSSLHLVGASDVFPAVRNLIVPVGLDDASVHGALNRVPQDIADYVAALRNGVAPKEPGAIVTGYLAASDGTLRVVLVGIDEAGDAEGAREAFGAAISTLPAGESVALIAPADDAEMLRAAVDGVLLGDYVIPTQRSTAEPRSGREVFVLTEHDATSAAECLKKSEIIAEAVAIARDLGNAAPSELTPASFADRVRVEGEELGLDVSVLDESALVEAGCGGILGVGRGSVNAPRLVRVGYAPANARAHIALVGKGITFDSGGLGIKNRAGMLWMKIDMGGAAAVYAAILAIRRLGLPVQVTGWLALAENMPSGTATKPGDVLHMRNGKTVEVTDTDAEGRLVLADGLASAALEKPDLLVDMATLTGAQIIALGQRTSAVMARDDAAAARVLSAADSSGERMWRLPMPQHLRDHLTSSVADLANMGGTDGGVIVGAHFLEAFVPAGQPWVHVDIAGPAINTTDRHGYTPHGATGAGVRMLVELAHEAVGNDSQ